MKKRFNQAGYTASAMAIMLTVASVTTVGVSSRTLNYAAEAQGRAHGKILSDVNQAIGVYMANNYPALQNGTPVAGVANPYAPTIQELQAMGGLNAQLSPTPPLGGAYATQIAREPMGCAGSGCNLTSRVWLTSPFVNNDTGNPDIRRLGAAAMEIGGDGGFSDNTSPGTVRGMAGWSQPNPVTNQAGILLAINGYGSSAFGQFFRKDGSVAMTGTADFGNQSLNNANVINAKRASLSTDGAGTCCSPGSPTLMLSENTATSGRKPTIQLHSGGYQEGYIELSGAGEPRRLNLRDNQGAGLGLNATGAVSVPGGNNIQVGSVALYGDSSNSAIRQPGAFHIQKFDGSSADIAQVGNITTYGQVNAASSHVRGTQFVAGDNIVNRSNIVAGAVRPSAYGDFAYEGAGCWEGNGAMRSNPSGIILSCQGGVWRKAGGDGGGDGRFAGVAYQYVDSTGSGAYLCFTKAGANGSGGICPLNTEAVYNYFQTFDNGGSGGL